MMSRSRQQREFGNERHNHSSHSAYKESQSSITKKSPCSSQVSKYFCVGCVNRDLAANKINRERLADSRNESAEPNTTSLIIGDLQHMKIHQEQYQKQKNSVNQFNRKQIETKRLNKAAETKRSETENEKIEDYIRISEEKYR